MLLGTVEQLQNCRYVWGPRRAIEATARPLVRVHELVADFTRDHDGLRYLLQIKAIVAAPVGSSVLVCISNSLLRVSAAPENLSQTASCLLD